MDDNLLAYAVDAHGGLERWNRFTRLAATVSIDGAIWHLKQQTGLLAAASVGIDTRAQHVTISPFTAPELRSVFAQGRLTLESAGGVVADARDDPAGAFAGQTLETPWDAFHVAYFASEALWTYLTSPFLYTYPGFACEEIEPWHENGEVWRSLQVTFPPAIATHTRTQITRFGPDGLMRRHDYTVDILGGATGANYVGDYRDVQGIMMPFQRRIYAYDDAMRKIAEPLLVSLDFGAITLS
jgi:hypothetical protein